MEAGKNFVDLLLSFLTLPTGTVLKLLTAANSKPPGAISNVFDSVKHLEKSSLYVDKDVLLEQKPFCPAFSNFGVLRIEPSNSHLGKGPAKTYLRCRCFGVLHSEIIREEYGCDSCNGIRQQESCSSTVWRVPQRLCKELLPLQIRSLRKLDL